MGWLTGMTNEKLRRMRQDRLDEIHEINAELRIRKEWEGDKNA